MSGKTWTRTPLLGVVALIAMAAVLIVWRLTISGTAQAADPAPQPMVPVTAGTAQVRDVPVLLTGLGTVQALNTVEIKAEVNGTLIALPQREGQEVHKGDVIAAIDPAPYQAALDQAIAQRNEDAATLRSAQLDLARYVSLAKTQFAPTQQVDDQQAMVDKQIGALGVDNAMIETARINLGYCVIRAPFDGRVGLHQVDVGNLVQAASQTGIISLTQDKPISVVFTLPEAELGQVQAALAKRPVPVQAAGGDDPAHVENGTLLTPNNTIDTATGTIALKANFANDDDRLWPGEFVNTRTQVDILRHAVTVPRQAVQHGPDGIFVYLLKTDQTVAQAGIQLGYQNDSGAVVTQGLSGGETVVLTGQSRLAPGVRVKVTNRAASAS